MSWRGFAVGISLAIASTSSLASLTCDSTTNWGSLGPPGFETFGNSFDATGTHYDCYVFSLGAATDSFGGLIEIDPPFNRLVVEVSEVSLYLGDSLMDVDAAPTFFAFLSLPSGGYTLVVEAVVTADPGFWAAPVGYAGIIATIAGRSAAVPVPATVALLAIGLMGMGIGRRRKSHQHDRALHGRSRRCS